MQQADNEALGEEAPGSPGLMVLPHLRRLLPSLRRHRGRLVFGLACLLLTTAASVANPWVLRHAVDDLTIEVTREKLWLYAGVLLALVAVEGVFLFLKRRVLIGASRTMEYELRNEVFDHLTRRVALLHDGPDAEREALRREVIERLRGPVPAARTDVAISPVTASMSEADYSDRVNACKEYIAAGDIYQIVLSVLFRGKTNVAPFQVYRALRLLNPSPYMFFFDFDDLPPLSSHRTNERWLAEIRAHLDDPQRAVLAAPFAALAGAVLLALSALGLFVLRVRS